MEEPRDGIRLNLRVGLTAEVTGFPRLPVEYEIDSKRELTWIRVLPLLIEPKSESESRGGEGNECPAPEMRSALRGGKIEFERRQSLVRAEVIARGEYGEIERTARVAGEEA